MLTVHHLLPLAHDFGRKQVSLSPASDNLYTTAGKDQDIGKFADKSEGTGSTTTSPKRE